MKDIQIWDLLKEIEQKIEYQKTPGLRADTLLRLLQIEQSNSKEINLLKGAQLGLDEMFAEMNKVDQEFELKLAIEVLSNYLKSGSFNLLVIPVNGRDQMGVKTFDSINKELKMIVEKYDSNTAQLLN